MKQLFHRMAHNLLVGNHDATVINFTAVDFQMRGRDGAEQQFRLLEGLVVADDNHLVAEA